MVHRGFSMKTISTLAICILLTACGGSGGGGKNDIAATACDAYAKSQLADKPYKLDLGALAVSMKDDGTGSMLLTAPIVINPGVPSAESKQSLECQVRFTAGKAQPDVTRMQFIW